MKKWISFLPAVLFYSLVFLLSSLDIAPDFNTGHLDKVGHLFEFGLLGFLLAIGFFNTFALPPAANSLLTLGTGLILAFLDEFHQAFVPTRRSDLLDLLTDTAGLVFGIALFRVLASRRKRGRQRLDGRPRASS